MGHCFSTAGGGAGVEAVEEEAAEADADDDSGVVGSGALAPVAAVLR
jgi:hypothetical protein